MLKMIDLSQKMKGKEAKPLLDELTPAIGALQRSFLERKIPSVVIVEGWAASGRGQLVNNLLLALDPRGYSFHYVEPSDQETARLLPYARLAPADGRIAIFGRSWYHDAWKKGDSQVFRDIVAFERQLAEAGTFVFKVFLHIGRKEQRRRLRKRFKDPDAAWSIEPDEREQNENYDDRFEAAERLFQATETEWAPWTIVPAEDKHYAAVIFLTALRDAMAARLEFSSDEVTATPLPETSVHSSVLESLDYSASLPKKSYRKKLKTLQKELHALQIEAFREKLPVVTLFEGVDAAGKGGAIRRLTESLYPRGYEVVPIGPPNDIERRHHYLWRFWRAFPERGSFVVFDRSWYGRVLVERVEKLCSEEEWRRAYREINEMERHLVEAGTVLVKFWLQISPDEQLQRFESRRDDPSRSWKLTDEDWRNREKWPFYQEAAAEMLARTSTPEAPWTLIATDCKRLSRVTILETLRDAIVKGLER